MLEAAVGMSRQWDAFSAGKEVAESLLSKMKNKPKFVLFFSTIHYERNGGFQKLLDGIYSKLPDHVPLVGGTVTGAVTPDGCFTRGAFGMAISGDDLEVITSLGLNVKRNPINAARKCAGRLKGSLIRSKTKFTFANISNGTVPNLPFIGRQRIMRVPFSGMAMRLLSLVGLTLQYGVGREAEAFEELTRQMPDSIILGASTYDNNKSISNYQFFNKMVYTNAMTAVSLQTDHELMMKTTFGLKPTGIKLKIGKKKLHGCAFGLINGHPAAMEILNVLGWPENYLDERIYRRTYYYPLVCTKGGLIYPHVMGLFVGKYITCTYRIDSDELEVYSASGRSLLDAVNENLAAIPPGKKPVLAIGVECTARLEALGAKINRIKDTLDAKFQDVPYLVVYCAGEGAYIPGGKPGYFNESVNLATFLA